MGQLPSVINVAEGRSPDLGQQDFDRETMDQMISQMTGLDNNHEYNNEGEFSGPCGDGSQALDDFDSAALKINRVPKTAS